MKPVQEIKNTSNLQVSISPNPATNEVAIRFAAATQGHVGIRVTDASGASVYQSDLGMQQSGAVAVPLAKLAAGLYMVEVTSGGQKVVQKLIKE
jgi:hypothetical protein